MKLALPRHLKLVPRHRSRPYLFPRWRCRRFPAGFRHTTGRNCRPPATRSPTNWWPTRINKTNYPVGNRPAPPKGFRNREQHTAYYTSVINCLQDVWRLYLTALDIQQKPVSLVAYDVDVNTPVAPKDRVRRPSTVPPMPPSTYRGTFTSSKRKTGFTQATP